MRKTLHFIGIAALLLNTTLVSAQTETAKTETPKKVFPYSNRVSVQTGLLQDLLLDGQNIVVTYAAKRWIADWSHGNSLNFPAESHFKNNESYKTQDLDVHMPWTTGPSIGYRITAYFNVRAEFKAHRNEVREHKSSALVAEYNTYTIGVGAFYEYYPFRKKDNWLQGIMIEPIIRFWPNVGSSLQNDFTYQNSETGKTETLEAYKLGWLANINIGYTFGGK